MRGILIVVLLAAVSAGVFALASLRRGADDKPLLHVADEIALPVRAAHPIRGGITRLAQAPGDVEAVLEVDISSEIVSKIVEMPIEEGDRVTKGELLCRLDDKQLRADVAVARERIAQIQASIVQATADVEKSERDCERQKRLSEAAATSNIELLDYLTIRTKQRAALKMRTHELAQAEATRQRMEEDLKRTIITSPIDGVISTLNAKEGEVVITGTMNNPGTVLMTVTDLSRMQVLARIDEVEVPMVKPGQMARVYLQSDPARPVAARVARVASKGTKQPGRDVVIFEAILDVLDPDDRVRPGMTANVEIEVASRENAVTVPVEAVVHRMRKELDDALLAAYDKTQSGIDVSDRARQAEYIKVVYVKEDDAARVRLIQPGIADSRRVEIIGGVTEADEVIVGPYRSLDQLKDGKKVALMDEDNKKEGAPATAHGTVQGTAPVTAQADQDTDESGEQDESADDENASGDESKSDATASTNP